MTTVAKTQTERYIHVPLTATLTEQIARSIYRTTNIPLEFDRLGADTKLVYLTYARDVVFFLLKLSEENSQPEHRA